MNKTKIILISCMLLLTIIIIVCFFKTYKIDFIPDYSALTEKIAEEQMKNINISLERYYKNNNSYPTMLGKYFFPSLKDYLSIDPIYLYLDSSFGIKNSILSLSDFDQMRKENKITNKEYISIVNSNKIIIGLGHPIYYLVVKKLNQLNLTIYFVGKNGIDENGMGDDIIFRN